jgi:hypothetical protein
MSTYLHFGENEFFLNRTIKQLKTHTLNQQWANFNHTEYPPESKETIPQALFRYHDTTSWEWRKISTFAETPTDGIERLSCFELLPSFFRGSFSITSALY